MTDRAEDDRMIAAYDQLCPGDMSSKAQRCAVEVAGPIVAH